MIVGHPRQGARLLRRLRVLRHDDGALPRQHGAHADLLHRDRRRRSWRRALAALEILCEQPRRVERLSRNARTLRTALADQGLDPPDGETPIVPVVVGDAETAMALCERLLRAGVFAQAIRPPTVPDGTSRLRLAAMATHKAAELRRAAGALAVAVRQGRAARSTGAAGTGLRLCRVARARPPRGMFVTGTDTEVGKTVVASAIAATLAARGERVSVFKPVVTGARRARGRAGGRPRAAARRRALRTAAAGRRAVPVRPAVSPHLAAAAAGERVDPHRLLAAARRAAEAGDVLVAEGVGGLLVPLSGDYLVRDLAADSRHAGRDRGAARARDHQPHADDDRMRAGRGPRGRRRRAHAVAGAGRRDGALQPRDDRAARRRRGRDAAGARAARDRARSAICRSIDGLRRLR